MSLVESFPYDIYFTRAWFAHSRLRMDARSRCTNTRHSVYAYIFCIMIFQFYLSVLFRIISRISLVAPTMPRMVVTMEVFASFTLTVVFFFACCTTASCVHPRSVILTSIMSLTITKIALSPSYLFAIAFPTRYNVAVRTLVTTNRTFAHLTARFTFWQTTITTIFFMATFAINKMHISTAFEA